MTIQHSSEFTRWLYDGQCRFHKAYSQDPTITGLIMTHLVGRIITIGVTLLLHAEAVCKIAAACFAFIQKIFATSNEEILQIVERSFENSKAAYVGSWNSFRAIFDRSILNVETPEVMPEPLTPPEEILLADDFEPLYAMLPQENVAEIVNQEALQIALQAEPAVPHQQLPVQEPQQFNAVLHIHEDDPLEDLDPVDEEVQFAQVLPLAPIAHHQPQPAQEQQHFKEIPNINDDPLEDFDPVDEEVQLAQIRPFAPIAHHQPQPAQEQQHFKEIPNINDDPLEGLVDEEVQFAQVLPFASIAHHQLQPAQEQPQLYAVHDEEMQIDPSAEDFILVTLPLQKKNLITSIPLVEDEKLPPIDDDEEINRSQKPDLEIDLPQPLPLPQKPNRISVANLLREENARAIRAISPAKALQYVSGAHLVPNQQWEFSQGVIGSYKISQGVFGSYKVGGCHFTNGQQGTEHLVTDFILNVKGVKGIEDEEVPKFPLIGIFDPKGSKATQFIQAHLSEALQKHLSVYNADGLIAEGIWNGITSAFSQLNTLFLQKFPQYPNNGSSATFVMELDKRIWIASIGSTRAALSNGGQAIQCTGNTSALRFGKGESSQPSITCYPMEHIAKNSHLLIGTEGLFAEAGTETLVSFLHQHQNLEPLELARDIVYSVSQVRKESLACFVMSLESVKWEYFS